MCDYSIEILELLLENEGNVCIREVNKQSAAEYLEDQANIWKQQGMLDQYQKKSIHAEITAS